jgi:hypothetical protein
MHSVEIACNDNKRSPMMLGHTAPDHDGPSTSKLIPLQSTGLGVMLIPSTINTNPTITPGETKPRLVSEEHFLPVLLGPAMVGIADSLSTDGGIVRSWCNSGSCCCHPVPVPQV